MGSSSGKRVRRVARAASVLVRPLLEALEDRTVPAQFIVGAGDVATLIADINTANSNGQSNTINLTAGTYDLTEINNYWYGPNGLPAITSNLTLNGNGAVLQRDSEALPFRLFYVSGGLDGELSLGTLTLTNVTLQNGIAQGGSSDGGGGGLGAGGAIFNQGTLNLNGVTLTHNEAIGGSGDDGDESMGGGGMGQDAQGDNGGGFGSTFAGGPGGSSLGGSMGDGGGGGGFVPGANGSVLSGGGQGGFGSGSGDGGDGGSGFGSGIDNGGSGGDFGEGGIADGTFGGGGGGVGGGGGAGGESGDGGGGGFGGGGGGSPNSGGAGGFGGGGGHGQSTGAAGGFGGGFGGTSATAPAGGGGAGMGGALFSMGASTVVGSGVVTITNSTFTANSAVGGSTEGGAQGGSGYGGAIFNLDGDLSLSNDTLAANTVAFGSGGEDGLAAGGAVYNLADYNVIQNGSAASATLTANNSIFAQTNGGIRPTSGFDGSQPQTAKDSDENFLRAISGFDVVNQAAAADNTATVTGSTNLVMDSFLNRGGGTTSVSPRFIATTANPNLGPLQYNGGPTQTMADAPGSAAYGAGDASVSGLPATDQRGLPRLSSQGLDLGAFEFQTVAPPPSPSPPTPTGPSGDVALLFLAEDVFALTVDSVMIHVSTNPAITQLADHLMMGLNELAHLFNPALGTGLAGLQSAIKANPYYGTPQGDVAIATGLDRAAIFFATHDLN